MFNRQEEIEDFSTFARDVDHEIAQITSLLKWDQNQLMRKGGELFACPYNSSHRMQGESLEHHLTQCQWKTEGYGPFDEPFSTAQSRNRLSSIKLDEHIQNQVLRDAKLKEPTMEIGLGERLIPRTSNRLLTDFTRDERRALYEYAIANTIKPEIGKDIADPSSLMSQEKNVKELSYLELLAQERNLKRRRAKHRGVHTNRKSQTEILREVINQQMEFLMDQVEPLELGKPSGTSETACNNDPYSERPQSTNGIEETHRKYNRRGDCDNATEMRERPRSRSTSRSTSRSSSRKTEHHRDKHSSIGRSNTHAGNGVTENYKHYSTKGKFRSKDKEFSEERRHHDRKKSYKSYKSSIRDDSYDDYYHDHDHNRDHNRDSHRRDYNNGKSRKKRRYS